MVNTRSTIYPTFVNPSVPHLPEPFFNPTKALLTLLTIFGVSLVLGYESIAFLYFLRSIGGAFVQ